MDDEQMKTFLAVKGFRHFGIVVMVLSNFFS